MNYGSSRGTGFSGSRVYTALKGYYRAYPAERDPHVVLVIDNAPWHHGGLITKVLDRLPQLRLHRLPRDSPQL